MTVATQNGSGSQTANNIIAKTLFRSGIPIGAKNQFPSNIQGLPTWFSFRVNDQGFVSREAQSDVLVAMNKDSFDQDVHKLKSDGYFIYNQDFKLDPELTASQTGVPIPFRQIVKGLNANVKLSKLLTNIVYVGILSELLELNADVLQQTLKDEFKGKESVIETNLAALTSGIQYAKEHLKDLKNVFPYRAATDLDLNKDKIFIDGNRAAALGFVFGGTHLMSWYPITPSSSLAESFEAYSYKYLSDGNENNFAIIQAEDELSAINMVLGAAWVGARAVTPTSGPGLSLMAEAAGLSYFAEIPAVIWDVQRAGPSTGLPTRTLQGDLLSAYQLSHGDTEHIVLLPSCPEECFEFAKLALDLSEKYQTLVTVLSDLDLGMNFHTSEKFKSPQVFERGKVLTAEDLKTIQKFNRYQANEDGIAPRTLPGTKSNNAAYFTRGTGHAEDASYSENPEVFESLLKRLSKKISNAIHDLPKPEVSNNSKKYGVIAYGSSDQIIPELKHQFKSKFGEEFSYMKITSLPLNNDVFSFVENHEMLFVIEQNRDGQLLKIIKQNEKFQSGKLNSICSFDGLPLCTAKVFEKLCNTIESGGGTHV